MVAGGSTDVAVDYGPPVTQPAAGDIYRWLSGNLTDLDSVWAAPLRIAINEVDFRGALAFKYYHQVVDSIAVENSTEWGMFSVDGSSEYAGGSPYGGYPLTIIGSGFDGYDGNASTVRVRFTTVLPSDEPIPIGLANATNSSNTSAIASSGALAANATNTSVLNGSALVIEVAGESILELSPSRVVLRAPAVSLDEGEIYTKRGYPCWNPPCRRTVVTLAINGVDFVGRPEPLVVFFFVDPWRFVNLMQKELLTLILILATAAIINALFTWHWRFEVYDRYLSLKYRVKNRIIYPIMFR